MKTVSEILTRVPPLFLPLSKSIAGDIDCSLATLEKYSRDGSPYLVRPQAVIYPKNVTDIRNVLSFVREFSMPVSVCGKRNGKLGGVLCEGVILDMSRYFNNMRHINMGENLVTVDAGVTVKELCNRLDGWGYELPTLLKTEEDTTLGGLFSTKSVSPSSFFHGSLVEWVEGLSLILDNGEEHKVAEGITPSGRLLGIYQEVFPLLLKEEGHLRAARPSSPEDATGYSLWSTLVGPRQLIEQLSGSEGTLGIITSVTLRLIPKRVHFEAAFIPVQKDNLIPIVKKAREHGMETLFLYDDTFVELVERFHPTLLPASREVDYVLIGAKKGDSREKLLNQVDAFLRDIPVEEHLISRSSNEDKVSLIMTRDFLHSLCDDYSKGMLLPSPQTEGFVLKLSDVEAFLNEITHLLHSKGKVVCVTGCIGSGHLAITSLFDPYSKKYKDELLSYEEEVFTIAKKYKAGISMSSGDGIGRTPYISYCYNDTMTLIFEKIKRAWDPLLLLNPSKKVFAPQSYASKHLFIPSATQEKP